LAIATLFLSFTHWMPQWDSTSSVFAAEEPQHPHETEAITKNAALAPQEILQQMKKAYAACSTYADQGICRTEFTGADAFTSYIVFKITFVRPDQFRFEHRDRMLLNSGPWQRNIILKSGADIRTKWSFEPKQEKCASLAQAVAGATGISSGTAHTTPRMLLPDEVTGVILSDLKNLSLLPSESVRGRPCYRVEAQNGKNESETLWIDHETFMLRKYVEVTAAPKVITTTFYNPVLNEPIDEAEFRFLPPTSMNEDIFVQLQKQTVQGIPEDW